MSYQLNPQPKKDTEFEGFFGRFVTGIGTLKPFFHVISFSSQALAIYLITQSNLPTIGKFVATMISIVFAITVGISIEKGVAMVGRIWWRQILRLKFGNGYWWGMFALSTIILVPLILLSPYLSGTASTHSVNEIFTDAPTLSTDTLEAALKTQEENTRQMIAAVQLKEEGSIQHTRRSIKNKYKALRSEQYGIYDKYKKLLLAGKSWAQGHMDKATTERKRLDVAEREELALQATLLYQSNIRNQSRLDTALALIQAEKSRKLGDITTENNRRRNSRDQERSAWGSVAWWIAISGSLGVIFIIAIEELYRAGSGQSPATYINEEQESWTWKLRQIYEQQKLSVFTKVFGHYLAKDNTQQAGLNRVIVQPLGNSSPPLPSHFENTPQNTLQNSVLNTPPEQLQTLFEQGLQTVPSQPESTSKEQLAEHPTEQSVLVLDGVPVYRHLDDQNQIKFCNYDYCQDRLRKAEKRVQDSLERLAFLKGQGKKETNAYTISAKALINRQRNVQYWQKAVTEIDNLKRSNHA